jgi:hypothetical protein
MRSTRPIRQTKNVCKLGACPDLDEVHLLTYFSTAIMQRCLEQCLDRNILPIWTTCFFDFLAPIEGAHVCTSGLSPRLLPSRWTCRVRRHTLCRENQRIWRALRERRTSGRYVKEAGARSGSMGQMTENGSMCIVKDISLRIEQKRSHRMLYISGVI